MTSRNDIMPNHFFVIPNEVDYDKSNENDNYGDPDDETLTAFTIETFVLFVLAGCGMVAAGLLLDRAAASAFFLDVPESLVLVLALLGLKGNLEMTLASRISTMANLGRMSSNFQIVDLFVSNVALVQTQAIIISLFASLLATVSHLLEGAVFNAQRAVCLTITATATASVASFVLANLIFAVALIARRVGVNPDNVATPLAAATGDVTTLFLMMKFGEFFHASRYASANAFALGALLATAPLWAYLAARQPATRQVLKYGWFAIFTAMGISSAGGFVLKCSVSSYPQISLFQPVVNGAGGNLVAVQASKISTYLYKYGKLGVLPMNRLSTYLNPLRTFAGKERESLHACILLLMAVPGHCIFLGIFALVQQFDDYSPDSANPSLVFEWRLLLMYLVASVIQVAILLYICQLISRVIWRISCDPDTNSIPLLTAIGDLLGTVLLGVAFHLHFLWTTAIGQFTRE